MPNTPLEPNGEEKSKKKKDETSGENGLGNLPPLSDFDTGEVSDLDAQLPPLSSFDSDALKKSLDKADKEDFESGLPPISDIDIVIPEPTGGNIKSPVEQMEGIKSSFPTPPLSTPRKPSFQDLAADSDFSPETPEIGPGPISLESGLETPVADSAFGGGSKGGVFDLSSGPPADTIPTAPTQIIETPIFSGPQTPSPDFGSPDTGLGFGAPPKNGGPLATDIFGSPMPGAGVETPILDFSAGTGAGVTPPIAPTTATQAPLEQQAPAKPAKRGLKSLVAPILIILALIIGIVAGPYVMQYVPIPNPLSARITELETRVKQLQAENASLMQIKQTMPGVTELSREEVERLRNEMQEVTQNLKTAQQELESLTKQLDEKRTTLQTLEADLAAKNEQFVSVQEAYENLINETEIVKARQTGLLTEIERLTSLVGQLEEAQARTIAIKEAFLVDVDKLIIQIKESLPLVPEKYSIDQRLARAEALRQKAEASNWISPELQNEFVNLIQNEIDLAKRQEYFYAKITVTDSIGNRVQKWAECLMKGSWGVYYRTLDGKNIGVFQNTRPGAITPVWGYQENLPGSIKTQIEQEIISARPNDFEQVVTRLAEKQLSAEEGTKWQRWYSSL